MLDPRNFPGRCKICGNTIYTLPEIEQIRLLHPEVEEEEDVSRTEDDSPSKKSEVELSRKVE